MPYNVVNPVINSFEYKAQVKDGRYVGYPKYKDILAGVLAKIKDVNRLSDAQLRALAEKKAELYRLERQSPILFYEPYESKVRIGRYPQDEFHRSRAKIRLLAGGNRSGKSNSGAVEAVWHALGAHPYLECKVPNKGWIVSLDFPMSRDVAEQKIQRYFPASEIIKWDKVNRILYHKKGEIRFRSCDQDIQTFGGADIDWAWIDEEPPGQKGYTIWQELLMRTLDRKGRLWLTLTPVSGMSWSYDELYEASAYDKDIEVVELETYENPYLDKGEIDKIAAKLSKEELDMRLKGKYIQFSGLVYKEFKKERHVIGAFAIPAHWKKFRGIDHGINNPTACVWVAVNEKDELYVYDEYYETDKTIRDNCEAIKGITGGDKIEWTMIDPSTDARDPQTNRSDREEYRVCGIYTRAMRSDRLYGVNMVRQLLVDNPTTGRPRLFVFDHCVNLIKEISRYRWKQYKGQQDEKKLDEPVKAMDHAVDALRYLVVSGPKYDLYEDMESLPQQNVVWYR